MLLDSPIQRLMGHMQSTTYPRIRFFVAAASGRLLPNLNIQECGPRLCTKILVQNAFLNVEYATRKYLQQDVCCLCIRAENIEWFIEDQAFSPPSPPLFRQQDVSLSQSSSVPPVELTYGRGGGGGGGAKSYDGEKAWSSINHSILSALVQTAKPRTSACAGLIHCIHVQLYTVGEGGQWTKSKITKIFAWPKEGYYNCPVGVLDKWVFYEVSSIGGMFRIIEPPWLMPAPPPPLQTRACQLTLPSA